MLDRIAARIMIEGFGEMAPIFLRLAQGEMQVAAMLRAESGIGEPQPHRPAQASILAA